MGEPDAWDPGSPRNRDRTREFLASGSLGLP